MGGGTGKQSTTTKNILNQFIDVETLDSLKLEI